MKDVARSPAKVLPMPAAPPVPQAASHPGGGGRNWHAWWAGIAAAALVALLGTAIELGRRPSAGPPPSLLLAPVTKGRIVGKLQVSGRIEPSQVVAVSAATSGRLTEVLVAPGATVRAGQTLARLDPLAARAGVARAEARLVAAEAASFEAEIGYSRLERAIEGRGGTMPDLADDDEAGDVVAIAQARLAKALSEVKAREADYRLAVQQGRHIVVRAPASGVVMESAADPGQAVSSGGTLFRIAVTASRPRLVVNVPEAQMKQLAVGSSASFELTAIPGRTYAAEVREIGRLRGPDEGRQVPVVLEPADGAADLEMGMTARVILNLGQPGAFWRVPMAALRFAPQGDVASLDEPAVYLAPADGQASFVRVAVEVGASDGAFAEVRAPQLREGAAVVVGLGRSSRSP